MGERRSPKSSGADGVAANLTVLQFGDLGPFADADLVEPVPGMDHQDMTAAQALQDLRQGRQQVLAEDPEDLIGDPGGVGQGAQDVEDGAHPQFPPRADGMLHGTVVGRGEHEAHPDLRHATGDLRPG